MEDENLKQMYQMYEDTCREQYIQLRKEMNEKGITGEQANDLMRTLLPIGVECNLTMGFTIEALIHFMHKRLCKRADAPIRKVAQLMKEEVLKVEPRYKDLFVPQCVDLLYCPEKHSCGMVGPKEDLLKAIEEYKKH
jgi:thymidylate synthase ThyX